MPELPDVTAYVEALRERVVGTSLEKVRLASPFVLRTVSPSAAELEGKKLLAVDRMAKRIVFSFENELFIAIHLMKAGRFRYLERGGKIPGRLGLAAFDFAPGTVLLTEAGTKRRAAIHFLKGRAALEDLDPGGLEVMEATLAQFTEVLARENHTLKRSLADPHLFSGIGNAYSDEILHRAKLSPVKQSAQLSKEEIKRLFEGTKKTLKVWTDRLRKERAGNFPEKVTAFRDDMAVHGKYGKPCPVCGSIVQRIVYAENETNYCATCQTDGKVLADRSLSRLLKDDWPRTLEALENKRKNG
ncbi:MAG: DNA-formamidopyrimidine glycosylase family protein [Polyangiaceae bacterium]